MEGDHSRCFTKHCTLSINNSEFYKKSSCDDPMFDEQCRLPLAARLKMAWFPIYTARPLLPRLLPLHVYCGCALPLRLLRRFCSLPTKMVHYIKVISSTVTQMSSNLYGTPPCPEKIAQKNLKTMSWWWLTDWGPRVTMVVGLDLDTNRHGIPIPQGWITPTTRNPSPPLDIPQDAPRGNFVVICEMTTSISNAASWQAPLIGWVLIPQLNQMCVQKRNTIYYVILFYLSHAG